MSLTHVAAALLMVTIWGFGFIVIRWGLNDLPPMTLTVLRFTLAARFQRFCSYAARSRPGAWWRVTGCLRLRFSSGCCSPVQAGMPTGLASLVIQIQAFFTIGLVALLTHERTKPIQLVGATIAGTGLILVALHLPPSTHIGFVLVLASAASWAVANVIVKRIHSEQPLAVIVWASAAAAIMMLPVALVIEGPAAMWGAVNTMDTLAWLGLAFQAWPTTLLAFGIWAWLLRQHAAALIAPFALLVPIVAMSLAVLLLGEDVTWWKLASAGLVLSGLALNVIASQARRGQVITPPR